MATDDEAIRLIFEVTGQADVKSMADTIKQSKSALLDLHTAMKQGLLTEEEFAAEAKRTAANIRTLETEIDRVNAALREAARSAETGWDAISRMGRQALKDAELAAELRSKWASLGKAGATPAATSDADRLAAMAKSSKDLGASLDSTSKSAQSGWDALSKLGKQALKDAEIANELKAKWAALGKASASTSELAAEKAEAARNIISALYSQPMPRADVVMRENARAFAEYAGTLKAVAPYAFTAKDALRNLNVVVDQNAEAALRADAGMDRFGRRIVSTADKASKAVGGVAGQNKALTSGLVQASYAVDDLQYGMQGLSNNIAPILNQMGPVGSVIAIAAVGAYQLYKNWNTIQGNLNPGAWNHVRDSIADVRAELEELRKESYLSNEELVRMNALQDKVSSREGMDRVGAGVGAAGTTITKSAYAAAENLTGGGGVGEIESAIHESLFKEFNRDQKGRLAQAIQSGHVPDSTWLGRRLDMIGQGPRSKWEWAADAYEHGEMPDADTHNEIKQHFMDVTMKTEKGAFLKRIQDGEEAALNELIAKLRETGYKIGAEGDVTKAGKVMRGLSALVRNAPVFKLPRDLKEAELGAMREIAAVLEGGAEASNKRAVNEGRFNEIKELLVKKDLVMVRQRMKDMARAIYGEGADNPVANALGQIGPDLLKDTNPDKLKKIMGGMHLGAAIIDTGRNTKMLAGSGDREIEEAIKSATSLVGHMREGLADRALEMERAGKDAGAIIHALGKDVRAAMLRLKPSLASFPEVLVRATAEVVTEAQGAARRAEAELVDQENLTPAQAQRRVAHRRQAHREDDEQKLLRDEFTEFAGAQHERMRKRFPFANIPRMSAKQKAEAGEQFQKHLDDLGLSHAHQAAIGKALNDPKQSLKAQQLFGNLVGGGMGEREAYESLALVIGKKGTGNIHVGRATRNAFRRQARLQRAAFNAQFVPPRHARRPRKIQPKITGTKGPRDPELQAAIDKHDEREKGLADERAAKAKEAMTAEEAAGKQPLTEAERQRVEQLSEQLGPGLLAEEFRKETTERRRRQHLTAVLGDPAEADRLFPAFDEQFRAREHAAINAKHATMPPGTDRQRAYEALQNEHRAAQRNADNAPVRKAVEHQDEKAAAAQKARLDALSKKPPKPVVNTQGKVVNRKAIADYYKGIAPRRGEAIAGVEARKGAEDKEDAAPKIDATNKKLDRLIALNETIARNGGGARFVSGGA